MNLADIVSGAVGSMTTDDTDEYLNVEADPATTLRQPPPRYDPHERFHLPRVGYEECIRRPESSSVQSEGSDGMGHQSRP